jgi:hypothetical protein
MTRAPALTHEKYRASASVRSAHAPRAATNERNLGGLKIPHQFGMNFRAFERFRSRSPFSPANASATRSSSRDEMPRNEVELRVTEPEVPPRYLWFFAGKCPATGSSSAPRKQTHFLDQNAARSEQSSDLGGTSLREPRAGHATTRESWTAGRAATSAAGRVGLGCALTVATALLGCSPGNTGTLDLFPATRGTGGGTATSLCVTAPCDDGMGGATGLPASGGTRGVPDASPPGAATGGTGVLPKPQEDDAAGGRRDAGLAPGECESENDCTSGEGATCVAGSCVECTVDTDCHSGDRTHCSANVCVQCRDDSDCTGTSGKPGCLAATHRCEDCSKDAQCPQGTSCNLTQGKCR